MDIHGKMDLVASETLFRKVKCDELVYLAETPKDALKFVCLRGYKSIVTLQVKIYKKDENKLQER